MKKTTLVLFLLLSGSLGRAGATLSLPQLDPTQTDAIFRTLASTVAFRSVQPASSLGRFLGFSIGVTGIQASTNQITPLIGTGTPNVYDADINGTLQLPLGLAVEAGFVPSVTISGISVGRFGINGKWTFTDLFFSLPFDAALRASYTTASLSYSEPLNGGTVNIGYNSNMIGGNLMVSKKVIFLEPYVSYGFLQHSSTLSGSGTSSLFDANFPAGTTSISSNGSSGWFQVGLQAKLGFVTLAAEYDNLFLDDTYAARLAFTF